MGDTDANRPLHHRQGRYKSSSQAFWGAAAKLPTVDAILESCRALDEEGETINRDSVRKHSGVTFTNQLAAGIALYKRRRSLLASRPTTPAVIIELITQAVEQQVRPSARRQTVACRRCKISLPRL